MTDQSETAALKVPDVLGGDARAIESFYRFVASCPPAKRYVLDLSGIDFLKPYGAIGLIMAARWLHRRSSNRVEFKGLSSELHRYLERMDMRSNTSQWTDIPPVAEETWLRNPRTGNLLELTTISGQEDVEAIVDRARRIFSKWLEFSDLSAVLNILSELCANVYQHSDDEMGCAMMQRYVVKSRDRVCVAMAVGDAGIGIRGSLAARYGTLGDDPLAYVRAALQGKSSRLSGRGGLGLRRIQQVIAEEAGRMWLRSESAAVLIAGPSYIGELKHLTSIPGTQVSVEFVAPLRP